MVILENDIERAKKLVEGELGRQWDRHVKVRNEQVEGEFAMVMRSEDGQDKLQGVGYAVVYRLRGIRAMDIVGVWMADDVQGLGYGRSMITCMLDESRRPFGMVDTVKCNFDKSDKTMLEDVQALGFEVEEKIKFMQAWYTYD